MELTLQLLPNLSRKPDRMKTRIAKEYTWEMSHRLPFHDGPCKNLHGHSYKMVLALVGELDKNSMVLDYDEIDRIIRPLMNQLDHAFLCDKDDKLMIEFLATNGFKYSIIPYYTTSENLVTYFLDTIKEQFQKFNNLESLSITVFETVDAFAERTISLK